MFTKKLNIIMGNLILKGYPTNIFNNKIINFLNEISKEISKKTLNKDLNDLKSFGFWCRKKNIENLSKSYEVEKFYGRGTVLHIAPSNVPMNFAYSMAFGLLSGNRNIVRLPSRKFFQVTLLCQIMKKILKKKIYKKITNSLCLIRYNREDEISAYISSLADARLIWGGDESIKKFKEYPTKPRCIDLNFSNRYSFSLINSSKLNKLNKSEIKNLAMRFYNDTYLMDQQGCSSPQALIWLGNKNPEIKKLFWKNLSDIVNIKYHTDLSVVSKKISSLSLNILNSNVKLKVNYKDFKLVKIDPSKLNFEVDKIQCNFGTFLESNINSLDTMKKFVSTKFQTITYFGIEPNEIEKVIVKNGINGVDRIVKIGRAFDMGPIWDGFDIISSLSRIITK
tara:strand:- start:395 stop:1576 length:1182 start_codon:yes stop_codon:yes gene_type:complete